VNVGDKKLLTLLMTYLIGKYKIDLKLDKKLIDNFMVMDFFIILCILIAILVPHFV